MLPDSISPHRSSPSLNLTQMPYSEGESVKIKRNYTSEIIMMKNSSPSRRVIPPINLESSDREQPPRLQSDLMRSSSPLVDKVKAKKRYSCAIEHLSKASFCTAIDPPQAQSIKSLDKIREIALCQIPANIKPREIHEVHSVQLKNRSLYVKLELGTPIVYQLENQIGKGAFKRVFNISEIDENTIKHVEEYVLALGTANPENPQKIESLNKEMAATALNLSHVIWTKAAHSFVLPDGSLRMIALMPRMSGGDLFEMIAMDLPIRIRIEACKQLAAGLNNLHANAIIHQDVKPANAMFRKKITQLSRTKDIDLNIIDFGTHVNMRQYRGKEINALEYKGTIKYSSPERIAAGLSTLMIKEDGRITGPTLGHIRARELLYTNGIVDPKKVEGFLKKCEVYSYYVSVFEVLMGRLPKMALKIENEPMDRRAYVGLIVNRDTEYSEEDKRALFEEAKGKGVDLELIWRGMDPDPTKRPSLKDTVSL